MSSKLVKLEHGVVMGIIELPCHGIVVKLTNKGGGSIESDLHTLTIGDLSYNSAIDGVEALILAHAIAGIDIEAPKYFKGIEIAVESIENNT